MNFQKMFQDWFTKTFVTPAVEVAVEATAVATTEKLLAAAAEIDPQIMTKAEQAGNAGVKQVQTGQDMIATGKLNVARGTTKVQAATLFGFKAKP